MDSMAELLILINALTKMKTMFKVRFQYVQKITVFLRILKVIIPAGKFLTRIQTSDLEFKIRLLIV